jgi:hypothetical protein
MGGACSTRGRDARNILIRHHEGKRPLVIHRCIWEDTAKMNLTEMRFENVDWIHLAQVRIQYTVFIVHSAKCFHRCSVAWQPFNA